MDCFKVPMKTFTNLNVSCSLDFIVFWTKFKIIIYEHLNSNPVELLPDFLIRKVLLDNTEHSTLIILDCDGNLQVASLKLKNPTERLFKISFKPQSDNVMSCLKLDQNNILTLRYISDMYYLCVYKTNFVIHRLFSLNIEMENSHINRSQELTIFKTYPLCQLNRECLGNFFKSEHKFANNSFLVLICLDARRIYGCILDPNGSENVILLTTLYYCPSELTDIIIDVTGSNALNIVIGLKSGTMIKLPFDNDQKPEIAHLNIPIEKFIFINDNIFYSDGNTMWKSQNIFSKTNLTFKRIFVKQPRDFIKFKDLIICVTYSNLIYTFPFDKEDLYVKIKSENEYRSASKIVNSTQMLMNEILVEIKNNDDINKKIQVEENYTAAIALANRPDIIDKVLKHTIVVYESYEEAKYENTNLALTNDVSEYFDDNAVLIFIQLSVLKEHKHKFDEIFIDLIDKVKFHITFTFNKTIRTTSITLHEVFDETQFLIPVIGLNDTSEIHVAMKLVCPIAGSLDAKQIIWTVLSKKEMTLTSEHFIKVANPKDIKITCLKDVKKDLKAMVVDIAERYHGLLFNFNNNIDNNKEISYYIKLPVNYELILSDKTNYETLNKSKAEILSKTLGGNEFLKLNHVVQIHVRDTKIKLQIVNDITSGAMLSISGQNARNTFHIRNYFAQLLKSNGNDGIFIPQAEYTSLEDLRRRLVSNLCSRVLVEEGISEVTNVLNRNVVARFPL